MDENVQWLEEFLIYYLNLGFDHFYLYDNTGSIGRKVWYSSEKANPYITKYGFPIVKQDPEIWQNIYNKYKKYITYIKYRPTIGGCNITKSKIGQIGYNQTQNINKFIKDYKHKTEWCFFGDLDEFIFSPTNSNFIDLIKRNSAAVLALEQKIFSHRCLTTKKLITQEYNCVNNISTKSFGCVKNIKNIHNFVGKTKKIPIEQWRFNHYNFCPLMKRKLDEQNTIYELGIDSSMNRYTDIFNQISK